MIPARCVPWPYASSPSFAGLPPEYSLLASNDRSLPFTTREPKNLLYGATPESITATSTP
jgi:hypothetical protein